MSSQGQFLKELSSSKKPESPPQSAYDGLRLSHTEHDEQQESSTISRAKKSTQEGANLRTFLSQGIENKYQAPVKSNINGERFNNPPKILRKAKEINNKLNGLYEQSIRDASKLYSLNQDRTAANKELDAHWDLSDEE